jgi:hypothetical protein
MIEQYFEDERNPTPFELRVTDGKATIYLYFEEPLMINPTASKQPLNCVWGDLHGNNREERNALMQKLEQVPTMLKFEVGTLSAYARANKLTGFDAMTGGELVTMRTQQGWHGVNKHEFYKEDVLTLVKRLKQANMIVGAEK